MTQRQKSLAGGISVLSIAGLICKVVGVLYQIPLNNTIGPEGIGVYNLVFPSYNLLLAVSSVGIPVAISRMVAHYLAQDDPRNARRVFRAALYILTAFGVLATAFMMGFHRQLGRATATAESASGFLVIAPSLLFVCVMSAFRGFMQGRRRMLPTATSQLIEQVGKVFIALPLAMEGMRRGGYAMGAAGALLGTSIAEAAALLYMVVDHYINRRALDRLPQGDALAAPLPGLAREITLISIPITIGASIVPLAGLLDSFMLKRIMQGYMEQSQALIRYGVYSGPVISLINVPTAVAMAISANLVPAISGHRARGDADGIRRESGTGLRLASVIGFPSAVGMSLLAEPILFLLFGRSGRYTPEHLYLGAQLLRVSSLTILFFMQVQATSAILQALHKQRIPMYTLFLGIVVKVAVNYTAVNMPQVNITGAPYASLVCYLISAGLNLHYVLKYTGLAWSWQDMLLRPGLATLAMALPVALASFLWGEALGRSWLMMGLVTGLAVLLYAAAGLMTGAVRRSELPGRLGGRK